MTSFIEAMNYDANQISSGDTDPTEFFMDAFDKDPKIEWQLVDWEGNVWSEKVPDGE